MVKNLTSQRKNFLLTVGCLLTILSIVDKILAEKSVHKILKTIEDKMADKSVHNILQNYRGQNGR